MKKKRIIPNVHDCLSRIDILLVEDEPLVRESMERILKRRVREIYSAPNGEEGLALFKEKNPDIVITDIRMPVMDGLEMIKEIKKLRKVPIIITTGYNDEEFLIEAIELGIDRYIKKPISQNRLVDSLTEVAILLTEQNRLDTANRLLQTIMDVIPSFLMITDGQDIVKLNQTFLTFMGFASFEEFQRSGKTLDDYLSPKEKDFYSKKKFPVWFAEIAQHPGLDFTMYLKGPDDGPEDAHTFLVHITSIPDNGQYLLSFNDITLLETIKSLYHELSMKDPLTRIYNRKKFLDELQSEVHRSTRYNHTLSLALFDIDFFKRVNDTYGHQTGDKAILQIVKLIRNSIRTEDIFGRYGGEEFVICLPETGIAEATLIAERLRFKISQLETECAEPITCSFGVTQLIGGESVDELIKRADNALYAAKNRGRNRVEVLLRNKEVKGNPEKAPPQSYEEIKTMCYTTGSEEQPSLCAIYTRRSIRHYRPEQVPSEMIDLILRAGMAAPSAGNQQPWHFVVIDRRETLDRVPDIHPHSNMILEAPVAVLVCGDPSLEKHAGYWVQDCSAATENMLLEAQILGLGSVWLGVYPREDRVGGLRKLLSIPDGIIPFSLLPIGYPAVYKPPADRFIPERISNNEWGLARQVLEK
ncbi:MAG: hypothetical protein A2Y33_09255 [Spirochaetes bacterium GWF1_51_8]|nr:MAG: hypothetical protein A2Y33_09255 [Spirochaetes bacterium GWF1_51_8]